MRAWKTSASLTKQPARGDPLRTARGGCRSCRRSTPAFTPHTAMTSSPSGCRLASALCAAAATPRAARASASASSACSSGSRARAGTCWCARTSPSSPPRTTWRSTCSPTSTTWSASRRSLPSRRAQRRVPTTAAAAACNFGRRLSACGAQGRGDASATRGRAGHRARAAGGLRGAVPRRHARAPPAPARAVPRRRRLRAAVQVRAACCARRVRLPPPCSCCKGAAVLAVPVALSAAPCAGFSQRRGLGPAARGGHGDGPARHRNQLVRYVTCEATLRSVCAPLEEACMRTLSIALAYLPPGLRGRIACLRWCCLATRDDRVPQRGRWLPPAGGGASDRWRGQLLQRAQVGQPVQRAPAAAHAPRRAQPR
eukprot:scaffold1334_cov344-Prasinococcus_capsulatus_cf.AAC.3